MESLTLLLALFVMASSIHAFQTDLTKISAGKTIVWGIKESNGKLYYRKDLSPSDPSNAGGTWVEVSYPAGKTATEVSVSDVDDTTWMLTTDLTIYQRTGVTFFLPQGSNWQEATDGGANSDVGVGAAGTFVINHVNQLFYRIGTREDNTAFGGPGFHEIGGLETFQSVSSGKQYVWAVATNKTVWRKEIPLINPPGAAAWESVEVPEPMRTFSINEDGFMAGIAASGTAYMNGVHWSNEGCFVQFGYETPGTELELVPLANTSTVLDCCDLCGRVPACNAFTFLGTDHPVPAERGCLLTDSLATPVPAYGKVTGRRPGYAKRSCGVFQEYLNQRLDKSAVTVARLPNTLNAEECGRACLRLPSCRSFHHDTTANECQLSDHAISAAAAHALPNADPNLLYFELD